MKKILLKILIVVQTIHGIGQENRVPVDGFDFSLRKKLLLRGASVSAEQFDTVTIIVTQGWNLVSVPKVVEDNHVNVLFPSAVSQAYRYERGYIASDTIANGYSSATGYWIKFAQADTFRLISCPTTVMYQAPLMRGWNMIGTTTRTLLVDTLTTEPDGIVISSYYEYVPGAGYIETDTLKPGKGYWVKASTDGVLQLVPFGGGPPPSLLPYYFDYPAWHPGGEWIAVEHAESLDTDADSINDDLFYGIWLVDAVTGERQPLIRDFILPSWSPDGMQLAMVRGAQIFKVTVTSLSPVHYDTSSLTQLTFTGNNFFPSWSPGGQMITYDSNDDSPNGMYFIWKMVADGSQKVRISYEPNVGEIRQPFWSPDSQSILHYRYPGGKTFSSEIYTMDTSGSNPIRLTFNNATDRSPRYSPDGARIMFSSQSFFSGSITIWEMNNDGSNPQQLSPVDHIIADWKPDGTEIVSVLWNFTCPVEGNGQLWLMNADGTGLRQLTFYNPHH